MALALQEFLPSSGLFKPGGHKRNANSQYLAMSFFGHTVLFLKGADPDLIGQICSIGQWICFAVCSKKMIKSS